MPYRRTYKKRTRAIPKTQEKRIRKVVKSELKREIEHKYYDRLSTGNAGTTLVATNPFTSFVRGTGVNNYIGSAIRVSSIEIRGQLIAADAPGNMMRMIIIQDKDTSGVPNNSTMFAEPTYPVYSPLNKDYTDTYRILKDKLFLLTNDGVSSTNFLPKSFRYYISGKKLRQVRFTASGGLADAGSIWIIFVSDSSVATNPTWIMNTRVNYTDA